MATLIRHRRTGDKLSSITASEFNAIADAVNFFNRQADGAELGAGAGHLLVKNTSGEDLDRFGVLSIDGVVITPSDDPDGFANQPCFIGVATDVDKKWVLAIEPIGDGAIGHCIASGVTVAKVNMQDESDGFAEIADDETILQSVPRGPAEILYSESGTGEVWAVVRLDNSLDLPEGTDDYDLLRWHKDNGKWVLLPVNGALAYQVLSVNDKNQGDEGFALVLDYVRAYDDTE